MNLYETQHYNELEFDINTWWSCQKNVGIVFVCPLGKKNNNSGTKIHTISTYMKCLSIALFVYQLSQVGLSEQVNLLSKPLAVIKSDLVRLIFNSVFRHDVMFAQLS